MFCKNCGKELDENARYCSQCGTTIRGSQWEEVTVKAEDLIARVKGLISEGNVSRIVVRNESGVHLLEIPVTMVAVGTLLAPYLAALGAIAAIVTKATIAIEKRE
jgi:uncharacterized membrane protein YvbJ